MERAGVSHLYPRLLGPAWFDLDPVVRQVHAADQVITATLEIRHGKGLIARIVRAALRLPMSTDGRKTTLRITSDARTERWTRTFGRRSLVTVQRALSDGCLGERIGPLELRFRLDTAAGEINQRRKHIHEVAGVVSQLVGILHAIGPVHDHRRRNSTFVHPRFVQPEGRIGRTRPPGPQAKM